MPVFSIICPVYNVEKYIRSCVESIVNQTFSDFEVVFIDDCGSDNSIKIIEEYAKKDSRIKIIKNDINKKLPASLNVGLDSISGEYFIFLDSDDWIELNTLEILYNNLKSHDVNSIIFDAKRFNEYINDFDCQSMFSSFSGNFEVNPFNMNNCPHFYWGKAYKLSTVKKYGIKFREDLVISENITFFFEYYTFNPYCFIIEDKLYNYRIRPNSLIRNAESKELLLKDNEVKIIRYLNEFYKKNSLYEKYKPALFTFISNAFNGPWIYADGKKNSLQYSIGIIKELDFINTFKDFDYKLYPFVSLILPIGNEYKEITGVIKSVQSQSYKNFELICLYNNENAKKLLYEFCKKDKRIKSLECNNADYEDMSVKVASGDFTVFINDFNILESNFVKEKVDKYKEINMPMKCGVLK